ncbi:MAG TPA: hypothetical protein VNL74_10625 [Methylococcus sp.]|nr:hypothetical protein [Methylococcus sp.]
MNAAEHAKPGNMREMVTAHILPRKGFVASVLLSYLAWRRVGRAGKRSIAIFFTVLCSGPWFSSAVASPEWRVLGNTLWASGDNRLTLEMPSVAHPYLRVTSTDTGDAQWISASIPFAWQKTHIKAIYLCYQTPEPGASINQIRLTDYVLPTPATVRHDSYVLLSSPTGECYFSNVGDYVPSGAVNLSLRLVFENPGSEIRLGALAILVDE